MSSITSNTQILTELMKLEGASVLDVGSGDGAMVRFMTDAGAMVVGLECGIEQLAKANSTPVVGNERYMQGVGQALPFDNESFDAVTFFMSLHHVPESDMATALQEAARVIKPEGIVYVAEPLARGSGFEVHAPIDDETHVRQKALEAMHSGAANGLKQIKEYFYDTRYCYADFAEYKDQLIRIDPSRARAFESMETQLKVLFDELGTSREQGVEFEQPMRVNVFRQL
ncbi:MAG: class I SAM-dependent methyltransferase [Pseudomonadales bacterium]